MKTLNVTGGHVAKLCMLLVATMALPAMAAERISMGDVAKGSLGDASPRALQGKLVVVNPTRFGSLGYEVAKFDDLRFHCQSGDKNFTAKKPAVASFEGLLLKAQGWDGATIWTLADCKPAAAAAAAAPAEDAGKAAHSASASTSYTAGNNAWSGDVTVAGSTVTISTASARGSTCDMSGKADFKTPTLAIVTSKDEPSCKAQLTFAGPTLQVKTSGCESFCGAAGPGFDHAYRLSKR